MTVAEVTAALSERLEKHLGLFEEFHKDEDRGCVDAYLTALDLVRRCADSQ